MSTSLLTEGRKKGGFSMPKNPAAALQAAIREEREDRDLMRSELDGNEDKRITQTQASRRTGENEHPPQLAQEGEESAPGDSEQTRRGFYPSDASSIRDRPVTGPISFADVAGDTRFADPGEADPGAESSAAAPPDDADAQAGREEPNTYALTHLRTYALTRPRK